MKYTENYQVMAHDAEPKGIMRFGGYLKYMQETANHQLRDQEQSYYDLFNSGYAFVLTRFKMKVLEPLNRYDKFESISWYCPSKGVMFQRCYEIRKEGRVCAQANSVWALVGINDGKLIKVEDYNTLNYTAEEALAPVNDLRFRIPQDAELILAGEKTVMYSEVDVNMHMNNRFYPDVICDYIPDIKNLTVTEMSISFVSEAHLGCTLKVYRSDVCSDGYMYFKTMNGDKVNVEARAKF
ncbi:MAG: hypothetical protein IIZ46_02220 [Clostridia bacterium]|nr:hypothetical protein [Clostridia bacterium]